LYKGRLRRQLGLIRAARAGRQLASVQDNTKRIDSSDILLVCTLRNERVRLPYFLQYYRDLGVSHFLFIDNDSNDGSSDLLLGEDDISLWHTKSSYADAQFGVHWMNWLAKRYCTGHWTLTVDTDELFVFPFCDTRPLGALAHWLDTSRSRQFPAMLIDMYPKGPIGAQPYREHQDPLEIAQWFDSGNYTQSYNPEYQNLWIQGGPRAREFFSDAPEKAPALNKIPLVKWRKDYVYVKSTHMLLPRGLNHVYETNGGERACGALLHTKFLNTFAQKVSEEIERGEHYKSGQEYLAYGEQQLQTLDLWSNWSEKYINWRQLEILGLISKGNWI
jgi:hypothetical protein